jgi:hypothetical protein
MSVGLNPVLFLKTARPIGNLSRRFLRPQDVGEETSGPPMAWDGWRLGRGLL